VTLGAAAGRPSAGVPLLWTRRAVHRSAVGRHVRRRVLRRGSAQRQEAALLELLVLEDDEPLEPLLDDAPLVVLEDPDVVDVLELSLLLLVELVVVEVELFDPFDDERESLR